MLPELRLIVITRPEDRRKLFESLLAGASGVLVKPVTIDECVHVTLGVVRDGAALSRQAVQMFVSSFHQANSLRSHKMHLTSREHQIMALLLRGYRDKRIAEALSIGRATVHTHLFRMFDRIGVPNRRAAVRTYLQSTNGNESVRMGKIRLRINVSHV